MSLRAFVCPSPGAKAVTNHTSQKTEATAKADGFPFFNQKISIVRLNHLLYFVLLVPFFAGCTSSKVIEPSEREKTTLQSGAPWRPEYDVRSDVVMVYGLNDSFNERVESWKSRGYNVQFMTGIAWGGSYKDYFFGKFDGKTHWDETQMDVNGDSIMHGRHVPYIVPSASFISYMKAVVKRVIDSGITTIYLEEPEFWARAGYSEAFKKEWQKYYGFSWRPQHESPEATYLSSKLKYQLYFNALKEVFQYAKSYGESKNLHVRCFVPTHSLINYSAWRIVSPEASLAQLPGMDGYIAQVWTGTSREPTYFDGIRKERVFENAFLEYGSMVSMTAPTGRKMYFLTDPIEDRPRTWDDFKRNYQATFTAKLLYPMVDNYEIMPWPERIYMGKYKMESDPVPQRISPAYATQVQVMVNSLNDMPRSSNRLNGAQGIAVLLGNTMMFQRFPTHKAYEDPQLSNFYGMALPLLKRGIPLETVHMENLGTRDALKDIHVLIMSYANMKPHSGEVHSHLANWVKNGGVLVYYGRDNDPFQEVQEWWNTQGNAYKTPSVHLFESMNIQPDETKTKFTYGKGTVFIVRQDPKELVLESDQDKNFLQLIKEAYEEEATAGKLELKNHFYLRRGPYGIASVMDESVSSDPLHVAGPVIDLFDPELPILKEKIVKPGEQAYLYHLDEIKNNKDPKVLCAASRAYEEAISRSTYSFVVKGPAGTPNVMRILLPSKPKNPIVTGPDQQRVEEVESSWDEDTRTCLLRFENHYEGVRVEIEW